MLVLLTSVSGSRLFCHQCVIWVHAYLPIRLYAGYVLMWLALAPVGVYVSQLARMDGSLPTPHATLIPFYIVLRPVPHRPPLPYLLGMLNYPILLCLAS